MQKIHLWIYGIFIKNNKILLIKKARWPYKWSFDLPWWKIEFGEDLESALKREIFEETWGVLQKMDFLWNNEYICEYEDDEKIKKISHHIWIYYKVEIDIKKIKNFFDGEDSLGSEFIDISKLEKIKISEIAKPIIYKIIWI